MAIVVDASVLFAVVDADDPEHQASVDALTSLSDTTLAITPFVLAEADHLIRRRVGIDAEIGLLGDVRDGAFQLAPFNAEDVAACIPIINRYRNLDLGIADASMVVLADRLKTRKILTLDRRDFAVIRPLSGGRFELLPS